MSQLRDYAQLVRLPNVFTAVADICLGALAAEALPARWLPFGLLALASSCLYCGGMVWNDIWDVEQDRKERPFRPIPSGKVPRRSAVLLGTALMLAGMLLGLLAGAVLGPETTGGGLFWTPADLAGLIVAAALLYDGWLKRTWAGPLGMGACRFLNVLLGLSAGGALTERPWGFHLALVVGLYIVGVTWFARTEARASNQTALASAAVVMLAALLLALALPVHREPGSVWLPYPYLLVGFAFLVGIPVCQAIARPAPPLVQAAVKRAIFGLVVLDAVLATVTAGAVGLVILILLLPAVYLGRRLYST